MGARAVLKSIIEFSPTADISIAIVWINKLPADSKTAAEKSARIFTDPRICQFYDPQQLSGRAIADSLGWLGKVAWDIYLFYAAGSQWDETLDSERLRMGDDLVRELGKSMKRLLE